MRAQLARDGIIYDGFRVVEQVSKLMKLAWI